jgi:hypothetical protein
MITNDIHQSVSDKAFAKITTLGFEIQDLKRDLKSGNIGPITIEEMELLITVNNRYRKRIKNMELYC